MLENEGVKVGVGQALVPHGGGILNHDFFEAVSGISTNQFGFDTTANPDDGLIVPEEHLHRAEGGVTMGVPVRPCSVSAPNVSPL